MTQEALTRMQVNWALDGLEDMELREELSRLEVGAQSLKKAHYFMRRNFNLLATALPV